MPELGDLGHYLRVDVVVLARLLLFFCKQIPPQPLALLAPPLLDKPLALVPNPLFHPRGWLGYQILLEHCGLFSCHDHRVYFAF